MVKYYFHIDFDSLPEVTLEEIKRNNGLNNAKTYVAIKNIVFDVSKSGTIGTPMFRIL
jgi:predicted heme/steroid binding protein